MLDLENFFLKSSSVKLKKAPKSGLIRSSLGEKLISLDFLANLFHVQTVLMYVQQMQLLSLIN